MCRAVRRSIIGGGGGNYSYTYVLPDYCLSKSIVFKVCEHEYMNNCPPPSIIDLPAALSMRLELTQF